MSAKANGKAINVNKAPCRKHLLSCSFSRGHSDDDDLNGELTQMVSETQSDMSRWKNIMLEAIHLLEWQEAVKSLNLLRITPCRYF